MERLLEIGFRMFGGAILLFFAFAPAWILFHLTKSLIFEPAELDAASAVVFLVCVPLLYFLLLLSYRAFTGRGRKQDGGLLPPLALKAFALVLGLFAIAIAVLGLLHGEFKPVLGGIAYLTVASALYGIVRKRERGEADDYDQTDWPSPPES